MSSWSPSQGPVHRVPKAEGSGASRRVSPAGPVRQGAPQLSTLRGVTQEARGWGGRGAKPPHPRGPPPSSACDWLGGRECPPRRAGGSRGRQEAQAGRGERAGRSRREGRARGSRGSPSGLGEAGIASGGGGSPAGSALSGERERERALGQAAARRVLGASSPRVPAAFREEAAPRPGAASPAGPTPPGGAEGQRVVAPRRTSAGRSV